jgi:hypothetical protein
MQQKVPDARVERMFAGDRIWAYGSILVLWCVYAFTYWQLAMAQSETGVLHALAIAGGLVLLFNTASIVAMITHYGRDKELIYRLDIHYLDEMKRAKG